MHGSPRVSYDVGICYQRSRGNLERLADALRDLHPKLRDAPPDLPFRIDPQSLALGCDFTFTTDIVDFDMLGVVEPIGDYNALAGRAVAMPIADMTVRVLSLDDLIRVKEHLGRPKDKQALIYLLAIRKHTS